MYCVLPRNFVCAGLQVIALTVKLPDPDAVVTGVFPVTGAVTVMAALVIFVGGAGDTVRLLVFAVCPLAVSATGVPLCDVFSVVPFEGLAEMPFVLKLA